MPEFDTSHVKSIVLLGHAGCGKTTLAECMLYEAGLQNRRGAVAEKCGELNAQPPVQTTENVILQTIEQARPSPTKSRIALLGG